MISRALDWLYESCVPTVGWDFCWPLFLEWLAALNAWLA